MRLRHLMVAAGLITASPALAQTTEQQARNASNWDVFQKLYPRRAIAAREEGAVGFTVTLNNKGDVTGCQVTHSSGHPLLDAETCRIITLNAVFKPDPSLGPSQTKRSEGVINWRLPDTKTVAVAPPTALAAASAPEKVVCKKTLRTGTLASYERFCLTPTEWAKQSDEAKAEWGDMQGTKGSTKGQ
jgi:TonB family protein